MGLFVLKERAFWGIKCHEEQLSSLSPLGWEPQGHRCQPDGKTYESDLVCD